MLGHGKGGGGVYRRRKLFFSGVSILFVACFVSTSVWMFVGHRYCCVDESLNPTKNEARYAEC